MESLNSKVNSANENFNSMRHEVFDKLIAYEQSVSQQGKKDLDSL
jgi:hypothetical protein